MKRVVALFSLIPILATATSQSQTATAPSSTASNAPDATSQEHIYGSKDAGVKPPKLRSSADPEYPKSARKRGKEGTVLLWVVVGSDGLPRVVAVARSLGSDFDQAAIKAIKKWKFYPATKDGKPVPVKINVELTFNQPW
jgi:TonB family protein